MHTYIKSLKVDEDKEGKIRDYHVETEKKVVIIKK